MWHEIVIALFFSALALPILALGGMGIAWLIGSEISEGIVTRVSVLATGLAASCTVLGATLGAGSGALPIDVGPYVWFQVGRYAFSLSFRFDLVSVVMLLGITILSGLVVVFSINYVHREKGVFRYFILMLLFSAAMQWLVIAGSYDQLFVGWELVGLTSMLLIAFFHERPQPVTAAIRTLIVYKVADLGLLLATVLIHQLGHGFAFGHVDSSALTKAPATWIGLLILIGASGKAAQLPFSGWLPRAMEGPTTSSAIFYGALSVHAGIYLLIRSAPLFTASTPASVVAVVVGGSTALVGGTLSRVQADAKTSLAWASVSQLGLMVTEVGLHFPMLALTHLVGHASLRAHQLLRAPSLLHDTIALRKALGLTTLAIHARPIGAPTYRALRDGLFIDVLVERYVILPLLSLGRSLERFELAWTRRLVGGVIESPATPTSDPSRKVNP